MQKNIVTKYAARTKEYCSCVNKIMHAMYMLGPKKAHGPCWNGDCIFAPCWNGDADSPVEARAKKLELVEIWGALLVEVEC